MKKHLRIPALLIAAIVLLSLCPMALAAGGSGSITVMNPRTDAQYTASRIFDLTYSGDSFAYTIESASPWFEAVSGYSGLSLERISGGNTYVVTVLPGFSPADFAEKLSQAGVSDPEAAAMPGGTVSGLELGYYFVSSTAGALCALTSTAPDAEIYEKNEQIPFDKTVDDPDADIGQTVRFEITSRVPASTGYEKFDYIVSDTLSAGLTLNHDVEVRFGTDAIAAVPAYAANGFTLTLDMTQYRQYTGETVTISYTAVVNGNAVFGSAGNPNDAHLKYSNDPNDSESFTELTDEEKVYTCRLVIDKYDAKDENEKLSGAEFVLYKLFGQQKLYYAVDAATGAVSWGGEIDDATVMTTDEQGNAAFSGIEAGSYMLEEIKAPDGYNRLLSPVSVTLSRQSPEGGEELEFTVAPVENSSGTILPETGGRGVYAIYASGIIALAAAAAIFSARAIRSRKNGGRS